MSVVGARRQLEGTLRQEFLGEGTFSLVKKKNFWTIPSCVIGAQNATLYVLRSLF
jgi:hypothetical protein